MDQMVRFQKYFFLATGFLLGSLIPLFGNAFNFILIVFMFVQIGMNRKEVLANLRQERKYLWAMIIFLGYFSLHTMIVLLKGNPVAEPSYGTFEILILNFILVPVYVTTFRSWLTPELLRRFLTYFCIGCFCINVYIFFALTGTKLFSDPVGTLNLIYNTRFGENRFVLGDKFWLEIQALMLAVSALISYFLIIKERQNGKKIMFIFLFLALLVFLSFTVTKSAIIGFLAGFFVLNIYLFKRSWVKVRYKLATVILIVLCGFVLLDNVAMYEARMQEVREEIENVRRGEFSGGTIVPRVASIRESFKHFDEFGLWGLGVSTKHRIKAWFDASDMNIARYKNVGNIFLQYWVTGGIPGLAFVLFLFVAPVYRMIRKKKISYLIIGILLPFFAVSNTCVTLSWANSRLFMLLFLAMFCFYGDLFARLEEFSEDEPAFDKSSI